ncbi:MAG: TRAP transporter small permease [Rhodospirillales bacterium]|jgi:TRAP-type C4-dicarboxylate transport system permease small subunit|nr:TRAP transporter small permease [Rhodospirillales bacterium]
MGATFEKIEEAISRLLLLGCVVLVIVASLGRWYGHPIIWSVDIAQLLFIWICFLGANQAMRADQHVGVDLLLVHLPVRVRRRVLMFHFLLIEAFLAAMVYFGVDLTRLNVERQFSDTPLSYAWVTVAVPVGSALLFITILVRMIRMLREARLERAGDVRS